MPDVGRLGAWLSTRNWPDDRAAVAELAGGLEAAGFDAVWIGGAHGDLVLAEQILAATASLTVATGIVNVWRYPADEVAASHARVTARHPGRLLLGVGVGHAPLVEGYDRPLTKLERYLDELDAAPDPVPRPERAVAALRPRSLAIAADRARGAHPYLVPPEHTAEARALLGPDPLLAPEQKVFLGTDKAEARRVGREALSVYLELPNYLNNLRHLGFGDHDLSGGGSDRLVDRLVAWGSDADVRARIDAHRDAGADHVAIQLVSGGRSSPVDLPTWSRLAELLR